MKVVEGAEEEVVAAEGREKEKGEVLCRGFFSSLLAPLTGDLFLTALSMKMGY